MARVCSKAEWKEAAERRLVQVMGLKQMIYLIEEALKKDDIAEATKLVIAARDV